jgi:hypothetical protein
MRAVTGAAAVPCPCRAPTPRRLLSLVPPSRIQTPRAPRHIAPPGDVQISPSRTMRTFSTPEPPCRCGCACCWPPSSALAGLAATAAPQRVTQCACPRSTPEGGPRADPGDHAAAPLGPQLSRPGRPAPPTSFEHARPPARAPRARCTCRAPATRSRSGWTAGCIHRAGRLGDAAHRCRQGPASGCPLPEVAQASQEGHPADAACRCG